MLTQRELVDLYVRALSRGDAQFVRDLVMSAKIDTKSLAEVQKMAQQKLDLIAVYTAETSGVDGSAYGEAAKHIAKLTEPADDLLAKLTGGNGNGNGGRQEDGALMRALVERVVQLGSQGDAASVSGTSVHNTPAQVQPAAPKPENPPPTVARPPAAPQRPRGCFVCGSLDHLAA